MFTSRACVFSGDLIGLKNHCSALPNELLFLAASLGCRSEERRRVFGLGGADLDTGVVDGTSRLVARGCDCAVPGVCEVAPRGRVEEPPSRVEERSQSLQCSGSTNL